MSTLPITIRDSVSTLCEWRNSRRMINFPLMENLGEKIKKAREDRKLSRRQLLDRAGLEGSPPSRLSNYETGYREPTLDDIDRLARAMGLTLFQLLEYGNDDQHVLLDKNRSAVIEIWEEMEEEEQGLWLARGRKILESRDAGNNDQRDGPPKTRGSGVANQKM